MSQNERFAHDILGDPPVAVVVHIGAADADGADPDEDLIVGRAGHGALFGPHQSGGGQHVDSHHRGLGVCRKRWGNFGHQVSPVGFGGFRVWEAARGSGTDDAGTKFGVAAGLVTGQAAIGDQCGEVGDLRESGEAVHTELGVHADEDVAP